MAKIDNFEAFMKPVVSKEKEFVISERFKDKSGKIQKVKIKGLSTDEVQKIVKESGRLGEDDYQLTKRLVVECLVSPDLRNKALCDYYKVYEPDEVLMKIFSEPNEYTKLAQEVSNLLGIKNDKQLREEAKN